MKRFYTIFLTALSVIILAWFLPWLYSLLFPVGISDSFVAWSPVNNSFIVSEPSDKGGEIHAVDTLGNTTETFTKDQRDSLLPQIYFNQLIAKNLLPDSINGIEISVPVLKHSQWVFNSIPRDINKVNARVHMMMESMPERFDLEDPKVVFRFNDGIEFIDIATNSIDENKTRRFNEIFERQGFIYPMNTASANITTRKPYDEGYLIADANGRIFHLKMQAGRPFMTKINQPDSITSKHLFILENIDTRALGLISDSKNNLYVLEKEGYKLYYLPVGKFDPEKQKLSIVKNLFNWVVKISDNTGARWTALNPEDYSLLGKYGYVYNMSMPEKIASYIFPFELSFTSVSDCMAKPRIESLSLNAIYLNIILTAIIIFISRKKKAGTIIIRSEITLIFGIFALIPLLLIK